MQRQAIGVFRHGDVREKARARPAALDRQRRQRRLHDRLAGPAAQLRPHVLDHLECGRNVFQHLGHVLADLAQHRAAAAAAGSLRRVRHLLARQMRGQRLATCRLVIPRRGAPRAGGLLLGLLGACVTLRHAFLEFAEQQLELLDLAVELLRGAAEPRPSQHRELRFEMLDLQRLGIELRIAHREQPIAFGQLRLLLGDDLLALAEQCFLLGKHPLQRAGIAWRCGALRRHARHTM